MRSQRVMTSMLAAVGLLCAGSARAAVSSGLLLTNFTSATYALPSGSGVFETDPGVNLINIANSASCWTLVTDAPQLCMKLWKTALSDPNGTPLGAAGRYPGDLLCFQIGFSNCGGFTGWNVHITDVLPANVVKTTSYPGNLWVSGGWGGQGISWASSLNGPWQATSNMGQVAPMYMRWILTKVGMNKTGYIRYCVTVL